MNAERKTHQLADALNNWRELQREAKHDADDWRRRVEAARAVVWRLADDVRSGQRSLLDDLPTQVEHVEPAAPDPRDVQCAACGMFGCGGGEECATRCQEDAEFARHPTTTNDPIVAPLRRRGKAKEKP